MEVSPKRQGRDLNRDGVVVAGWRSIETNNIKVTTKY